MQYAVAPGWRPELRRSLAALRAGLKAAGGKPLINSVTGEPVVIRFRIGGLFRDFSVSTDPLTEAYYTSGTYSLSEAAATEATAALRFCSIGGMSLRLGFYDIEVREECLEVRLLWTI